MRQFVRAHGVLISVKTERRGKVAQKLLPTCIINCTVGKIVASVRQAAGKAIVTVATTLSQAWLLQVTRETFFPIHLAHACVKKCRA